MHFKSAQESNVKEEEPYNVQPDPSLVEEEGEKEANPEKDAGELIDSSALKAEDEEQLEKDEREEENHEVYV